MAVVVLDASAAANFLLPDENNDFGDSVLRYIQESGALVPVLWNYEIGSLLSIATRRQRIDNAYRQLALNRLLTLPVSYWDADGITSMAHAERIAKLANESTLSFYDATYLYIAQSNKLMLATLDRAMQSVAEQLRVPLFAG
jgi:predicted nucleic acid-binding protein